MSPTYAHLCHANRAAFGRKTAYASASCLVAFLSNLAFTKPGVFQVHITQGHGRNRRFSWQKRTQVEDFAPLGVASLGSKRFPTHGGRPKAAAGTCAVAGCALRQQQLRDLHGVQSRALADLVSDHPHGQAVINRVVSAQTTDVRLVRAGQQTRHGIRVRGAVVHDHDARERLERRARGLDAHLVLELHVNGLSMAA